MDFARYQRQIILPFIRKDGQQKLKIVDRDIVQLPDLQRQILYDEEDVKSHLPKAKIACSKLKKINSSVEVEAFVFEVKAQNIVGLIRDVDLVLDGTDNIKTRLLINEACIKYNLPWIHGAVQGAVGMSMSILPGETGCYRCLIEEDLPASEGPIPLINTIPALIASIQATEAIKIITGSPSVNRDLIYIDLWEGTFQKIKIKKRPNCPVCVKRNFTFF